MKYGIQKGYQTLLIVVLNPVRRTENEHTRKTGA
jgi:hypothetical protein